MSALPFAILPFLATYRFYRCAVYSAYRLYHFTILDTSYPGAPAGAPILPVLPFAQLAVSPPSHFATKDPRRRYRAPFYHFRHPPFLPILPCSPVALCSAPLLVLTFWSFSPPTGFSIFTNLPPTCRHYRFTASGAVPFFATLPLRPSIHFRQCWRLPRYIQVSSGESGPGRHIILTTPLALILGLRPCVPYFADPNPAGRILSLLVSYQLRGYSAPIGPAPAMSRNSPAFHFAISSSPLPDLPFSPFNGPEEFTIRTNPAPVPAVPFCHLDPHTVLCDPAGSPFYHLRQFWSPLVVLPGRHFYRFSSPAGFTILAFRSHIILAPLLVAHSTVLTAMHPPISKFRPMPASLLPYTILGRAPLCATLPCRPCYHFRHFAPLPALPFYHLNHFSSSSAATASPF